MTTKDNTRPEWLPRDFPIEVVEGARSRLFETCTAYAVKLRRHGWTDEDVRERIEIEAIQWKDSFATTQLALAMSALVRETEHGDPAIDAEFPSDVSGQ